MAEIIDNVFLPENIEKGARGSAARFNTTIFTAASGTEYRNLNWERSLGRWTISLGYRDTDDEDFQGFLNMFYAARGMGYGFLFKDWSDYRCEKGVLQDGVYYKPYGNGIRTYLRKITRIRSGTLEANGDGTFSFEFYVPVRFDTDHLDIEVEVDGLANIPNVDLVELVEG